MDQSLKKILLGYQQFRDKYVHGDNTIMQYLAYYGQKPEIMMVACCDSRVDPALILQCNPGELFVARNVANIVPPYEKDEAHHGTSAALEFGIRMLGVKHLILLGHSQCGGIQALLRNPPSSNDDFITSWMSLIKDSLNIPEHDCDAYAKEALKLSLQNCLTFPWIKDKIEKEELSIHLWFFDIKKGQIFNYDKKAHEYHALDTDNMKPSNL